MIFGLVILAILLIPSVFLITGHGAFLIAGYNTASAEGKARYDEKKLCLAVGVMMLLLLIPLAVLFLLPQTSPLILPLTVAALVMIAVSITGGIWYTNHCCFREDLSEGEREEVLHGGSRAARIGFLLFGVAILAFVGVTLYQSAKAPVYTAQEDGLLVSCFYGTTLSWQEMESASLSESIPDRLTKTNGSNLGPFLRGHFRSGDSEKALLLYVDTSQPPFVYLMMKDQLVILNAGGREQTEALYQTIAEHIGLTEQK